MINENEINLLQAQNEALKKQCSSLQQEVKQWKHEYEMLDACIELEQGKITELKAENIRLKSYLQEIKTIAEDNQFYFGAGTIVSYKTIKQIATDFEKILDLITKAGSEG